MDLTGPPSGQRTRLAILAPNVGFCNVAATLRLRLFLSLRVGRERSSQSQPDRPCERLGIDVRLGSKGGLRIGPNRPGAGVLRFELGRRRESAPVKDLSGCGQRKEVAYGVFTHVPPTADQSPKRQIKSLSLPLSSVLCSPRMREHTGR